MQISRRDLIKQSALAALLAGFDLSALTTPPAEAAGADSVLHLLRRMTYGPRPADVEYVKNLGAHAYLAEQLNGPALPDPLLKRKMASLKVLDWSRDRIMALEDPYGTCWAALQRGVVTRGTFARAQLFERMVEFWSDHFNIASDGLEVEMVLHEQVIRKLALTRFSDLLVATAQSPAMLYYLDNFLNQAANPNENYARELMELHTLGVDGGYTEADVKAVARAFTGWTVDDKKTGNFVFEAKVHDTAPKTVLGHALPGGRGVQDGLDVLKILATHPSTARFVCRKLAVRFVSDAPPDSLLNGMVNVWKAKQGAIQPVLRYLFLSPEFAASAGQKLRRPLDFYIGALRATGTEVLDAGTINWQLERLAQVPFGWHPPNGYPDVGAAWANTNGLLARWNTAFELTVGAKNDKKFTTQLKKQIGRVATVGDLVDQTSLWAFGKKAQGPARDLYVNFASDGEGASKRATQALLKDKLTYLMGLMLSSPACQWR